MKNTFYGKEVTVCENNFSRIRNLVGYGTRALFNYGLLVHYVYSMLAVLDENNIIWRQGLISGALGRYSLRKSHCISACIKQSFMDHLKSPLTQEHALFDWVPESCTLNACHKACSVETLPFWNTFRMIRIMSMGLLSFQWDPTTRWYRIGPSGLAYALQPDRIYAHARDMLDKLFPYWLATNKATDMATLSGIYVVSMINPGMFSTYGRAHIIALTYLGIIFWFVVLSKFCMKFLVCLTIKMYTVKDRSQPERLDIS